MGEKKIIRNARELSSVFITELQNLFQRSEAVTV